MNILPKHNHDSNQHTSRVNTRAEDDFLKNQLRRLQLFLRVDNDTSQPSRPSLLANSRQILSPSRITPIKEDCAKWGSIIYVDSD
jgi:hypothetical protein